MKAATTRACGLAAGKAREAQKLIRVLEANRKERRKRLFDAQDEIDGRRDKLIGQIEIQLSQQRTLVPLFTLRWSLN